MVWNKGLTKETSDNVLKSAEKKRGKPTWLSGLTKETDERVMKISMALKGRKRPKETIQKIIKTKQVQSKSKMVICLNCSKQFRVFPSQFEIGKGKFCSRNCYHFYMKGKSPLCAGKPLSADAKKKLSKSLKGRKPPKTAFKKGNDPWNKGLKGAMPVPWNKGEWKIKNKQELMDLYQNQKLSTTQIGRKLGLSNSGVFKSLKRFDIPLRNRVEAIYIALSKKPTKIELRMISIIKKYKLPYRYTGDGKRVIGHRKKCPDFLRTDGIKQILEIFGSVFHDPEKAFRKILYHQTEKGTINYYASYGFEAIVIWDFQLSDESNILKILNESIMQKEVGRGIEQNV